MQPQRSPSLRYGGVHCSAVIERPAPGVAVVSLAGMDTGELGDAVMRELSNDLAQFGSIELFIDAREVRGVSVEVSGKWALWLRRRHSQFHRINMLTGSRYVEITAEFVRRFSDLGSLMRIFKDRADFDQSLLCGISRASES